jgi:antitoxin HigA-1
MPEMPMKNPPHIGNFIRTEVVEPFDLSVTDAAEILGVTRQALNNLLNEKSALTPDMALRIEKAFGPKMDHLLRMQLAFDIAQARRRESGIKVRRIRRRPGPTN